MQFDTIAAIATPVGQGGLSVIRVSGPEAIAVADRVFSPVGVAGIRATMAASHTVHYGWVHRDGHRLDEVLLSIFRVPRSFTKEDTVELSCHGGPLVTKLVLETLFLAGARPAEPGEFTKRAFLNGRLDLAQAEAVADVIRAQTDLALSAAQDQLAGNLSRRIDALRDRLILILAHIEAHLDFPEEDIDPDTSEALSRRIVEARGSIDELLRGAREGQILREGVRAAIIGRPNVGKSSLLNRLLGRDRAIVSPIAGTTRDTIEEAANIRGIPVVFIDTAGLRESADEIEREGIRRSREALDSAEIILHVIDSSAGMTADDIVLKEEFAARQPLLVANKCDLPGFALPGSLPVSCVTGAGIDSLKDAMSKQIWEGNAEGNHARACINARHQEALRRAAESLSQAGTTLAGGSSLEYVAIELRAAVNATGEVVGKTVTEDLLDAIFSQFCLGK
jgi:tRNA modification GTPase